MAREQEKQHKTLEREAKKLQKGRIRRALLQENGLLS